MKPVLTDAQVDALLDSVLRASGSALSNYTLKKTLDDMREAVRDIERAACQHRGEPVGYVEPVVIEWLTDPERAADARMATTIHRTETSEGLEPLYAAPQPSAPHPAVTTQEPPCST